MKKIILAILITGKLIAQEGIGINTDNPLATLDIRTVSPSSPDNSVGVLFPTINQFPMVNPESDQNGMLVFLDNEISEGAGNEGLYFWDDENKLWQYIFQSKIMSMNLFKTIVYGTGFSLISNSDSNTNVWFKTNFLSIEAPDANYILENGDLVVGKTGAYSVLFTGGVYKAQGSTAATPTEVAFFVDNEEIPRLLSKSPLPSADNAKRSTNHTISDMIYLTKGQKVSIKTRRTANCTTEMGSESIYTLTLSYLD